MKVFASRGRLLAERLQTLAVTVREIRALMLVDRDGLTLVSTLHARGLEDGLAAFAGAALTQMDRASADFDMGPLHLLHLAGRDRQVFLTPVTREVVLLAVTDAGAGAATVSLHIVAMAREILELAYNSSEAEGATP